MPFFLSYLERHFKLSSIQAVPEPQPNQSKQKATRYWIYKPLNQFSKLNFDRNSYKYADILVTPNIELPTPTIYLATQEFEQEHWQSIDNDPFILF